MKRTPLKRGNSKLKRTKIKKQSTQSIPSLKRKADRQLQDYYRTLNLKCMSCGKKADIVHHFYPKSSSSYLRYEDINLIPLCHKCHSLHHCFGDPSIHAIIQNKKGEKWLATLMVLRRKYLSINSKKFLNAIIEKYEI